MFHNLTLMAAAVTTVSAFAGVYPYGICAHVTRSERSAPLLKGTLDAMDLAGMKYVRSDFDSWRVLRKDGTFDFSDYDALLTELEARGVTLLPIVYATENPPKDMAKYRDYVTRIVKHYGRRFPVVEIWNEANIDGFLKDPDPAIYAETLKTAYAAIKAVDPEIKVAYTGTAGVPLDWIRKTFEAGAAKSFDIMNVHPYSHPGRPEGSMDVSTEKLRRLLEEFGVGDRPVWFTEIGWPTHTLTVLHPHILLAGLKVARPEQKSWRMVLADVKVDGSAPNQALAQALEEVLPAGSTVVACTQKETVRRLAAGEADAVAYPFDESFPADTIDAVNDFIRNRGGVLVEFGGMPCYYGLRGKAPVDGLQGGGAVERFPFGSAAWWIGKKGEYPTKAQVFATAAGVAAGVKQEPTGFRAERFLKPDRIGEKSEWIPLVAGKTEAGTELVGAAVVRYSGEHGGAAVLCSLMPRGVSGTNDEENQARYTARGLAIAFAEGVEAYFTYNLRASEEDPYYSEHHFGLMHANFVPKPAFSAYAAFTRERPAGSVNVSGPWHDEARRLFFPRWTRPDGAKGGMVWQLGETEPRTLRFVGGKPVFRNMYGRKIAVRQEGKDAYSIPVGESPVYYSGAELVLPRSGALSH